MLLAARVVVLEKMLAERRPRRFKVIGVDDQGRVGSSLVDLGPDLFESIESRVTIGYALNLKAQLKCDLARIEAAIAQMARGGFVR
jgi:hypothetical protein